MKLWSHVDAAKKIGLRSAACRSLAELGAWAGASAASEQAHNARERMNNASRLKILSVQHKGGP